MNSLLHHAVNQVNKKITLKVTNEQKMDMVWIRVRKNIEELIQLIWPKKRLFFALDGVSPWAKANT